MEQCWGLKSKKRDRVEEICWSIKKPEPLDFEDRKRLEDYDDYIIVKVIEIKSI